MRSLRVRGWGCGKAIKGPRGRGPGPFSEKHPLREGGVVVQLQVGDGNTRGPCLQRPGGCFCTRGRCVSVALQHLTRRARLSRPSAAGTDAVPGPSVPEGRRRRLGDASGVTWLLVQQGWRLATKSP